MSAKLQRVNVNQPKTIFRTGRIDYPDLYKSTKTQALNSNEEIMRIHPLGNNSGRFAKLILKCVFITYMCFN